MRTLGRMLGYTKQKKGAFLFGLILLLAAVGADLMRPLYIQQVIDRVLTPALEAGLNTSLLVRLLAVYMGLSLVTAASRYFSFLLLTVGANTIVRNMRNDLYARVQKMPIRYFDNMPAGKVVSRITNDTEQLRIFYVIIFGQVLTNVAYLVGIYVALLRLHLPFGLTALLLVPLFIVWAIIYQKYAKVYTSKIRSLISDINAKLNEAIQGMPIIQSFQQEQKISDEFDESNDEWFRYSQKFMMLDAIASWSFIGSLRNLSLLLLVLYFGIGTIEGTLGITVGFLYVFVEYTSRLFDPIQGIVSQWAYLQQALTSAGRVFDMMGMPVEKEVDNELMSSDGEVVFDHVWFAYNNEEYVLKDISFTAKKGETVALVGHTGSGKSSIMNLLFRFYDPSKGTITVDGVSTTSVSRKSLRKHIGIVLQDPYLFKGTIASNVRLGEGDISDEQVTSALEAVGGSSVLGNSTKGLEEPVVDKGATLSSGQRQLVSFARALAFDPSVLILDEATSNIDTETEEMIQHAMDVVKQGRTTFIIAHRLSTIQNADKILVLDQGRIVERGTHDELLSQNGQYAQMYRMQAAQSVS